MSSDISITLLERDYPRLVSELTNRERKRDVCNVSRLVQNYSRHRIGISAYVYFQSCRLFILFHGFAEATRRIVWRIVWRTRLPRATSPIMRLSSRRSGGQRAAAVVAPLSFRGQATSYGRRYTRSFSAILYGQRLPIRSI